MLARHDRAFENSNRLAKALITAKSTEQFERFLENLQCVPGCKLSAVLVFFLFGFGVIVAMLFTPTVASQL